MDSLTGQQQAILDLERQFWRTAGAKEDAIRAMGLSPTRYYRAVTRMIHTEAAMRADPALVKRLLRIASGRRTAGSDSFGMPTMTAGRELESAHRNLPERGRE